MEAATTIREKRIYKNHFFQKLKIDKQTSTGVLPSESSGSGGGVGGATKSKTTTTTTHRSFKMTKSNLHFFVFFFKSHLYRCRMVDEVFRKHEMKPVLFVAALMVL
jgi:hypothetical protein